MTEPKVEAGDRALETAREIAIGDTFVAAVEDELDMGHGAWDMLDPAEVCKAVMKVRATLIQSAMNAQERELQEALVAALVSARGALRLDAMVDDAGKPFGTTTAALEAIREAERLLAERGEAQ